jgi:hypothetical protein
MNLAKRQQMIVHYVQNEIPKLAPETFEANNINNLFGETYTPEQIAENWETSVSRVVNAMMFLIGQPDADYDANALS